MKVIQNIPTVNKNVALMADDSTLVKCGNCGWEWEFSTGGELPLVCHKCTASKDAQSFSDARGRRPRKRRKGLNKAVGYVKDRREANQIQRKRAAKKRKELRPTPKMRPKPNNARRFDVSNPKIKPLPPSALDKQGSSANSEQPKSNKILYIVGGVAVLGIVAFIIYKRK